MTPSRILLVDDDPMYRRLLLTHLEHDGHQVFPAADGNEALAILDCHAVDLVISDLQMPNIDGLQLLEQVRTLHGVPVIVITAHGSVGTAVEAMRRGAYDFLEKPYNLDMLALTVERALDYRHVVKETRRSKLSSTIGLLSRASSRLTHG